MVTCTIDWSPMPLEKWDGHFRSIRRSTLLQHYPYALANRAVNLTGSRHGIIKIDGSEAGLVQLAEVGVVRNMFHAISLDRGPLWFDGFGTADHIAGFFSILAKEFPKRLGRKVRLLPELTDTVHNRTAISNSGFLHKQNFEGYETIWLDLTGSIERLRAGLSGKWRNVLSKSDRRAVATSRDWAGRSSSQFLTAYEADRQAKGYDGPSVKLLTELLNVMIPRQEAVILTAANEGQIIAGILVLLHGSSATYQTGWTTESGRKLGAHHQLLWQAILELKTRGVTDFDLGGVNNECAAGVKRFKLGLGGQSVKLVGFFS